VFDRHSACLFRYLLWLYPVDWRGFSVPAARITGSNGEGSTPRTPERVLRETGRDADLVPNVAAVATAKATRSGNNS